MNPDPEITTPTGWHELLWSFIASSLLSVCLERLPCKHVRHALIVFSLQHIFSPSSSLYQSLEITLPENGHGHSLQVYLMLAKVRAYF